MTLDELLHSPQFKQALFDVQDKECEQLLKDIQQAGLSPVEGHAEQGPFACEGAGVVRRTTKRAALLGAKN